LPIAIYTLFFAAFCIGTTEFVIAGLLPEISRDFDVSIPIAGYLITAYAVGVAIGGPIVTLATTQLPRKRILLLLMAIFIVGHIWCATAPNYEWLIAGRLVVALSHGSFFGVANVVAVNLVPEGRRGAAVAWLFAGITVANILGVPGGTAIGNWLGWRATFWVVGSAAVLVAIAMMLTLPKDSNIAGKRMGFRVQISALANQKVLLTYTVFAVLLVGFWSFFTFIAPFLSNVAGYSQTQIPVILLIFGIGATIGTMLGGKLADRYPIGTLAFIYPLISLAFLVLAAVGNRPDVTAVSMFFFGAIVFIPGSSMVNRVLKGAAKAPDLASTLVASAANVGIAVGAVIGAQALSSGISYSHLPVVSSICVAISALIMLLSLKLERSEIMRAGS
jgi:DHA1 family inner membrane transport protein